MRTRHERATRLHCARPGCPHPICHKSFYCSSSCHDPHKREQQKMAAKK